MKIKSSNPRQTKCVKESKSRSDIFMKLKPFDQTPLCNSFVLETKRENKRAIDTVWGESFNLER